MAKRRSTPKKNPPMNLTEEQLMWRARLERSRQHREKLQTRWQRVQDEIDGRHDFDICIS